LLVEQLPRLVVADLARRLVCLPLLLLALLTRVAVRHIRLVCRAVFIVQQLEAHKMAPKLLQAVQ
jgi:hypothetical protein